MEINFDKGNGLVPVIIQNDQTQKVLMLGYMNEEALQLTLDEGVVTFYSRSKQRLWTKGETSGNYLEFISIEKDCDEDALLMKVLPKGVTCHTGKESCFDTSSKGVLYDLEQTINERIDSNATNSYTNQLYKRGINKVAQKVGEEAVELLIEAKDQNEDLFLNEAADLMYHYLVLLKAKGKKLSDVEEVLMGRN